MGGGFFSNRSISIVVGFDSGRIVRKSKEISCIPAGVLFPSRARTCPSTTWQCNSIKNEIYEYVARLRHECIAASLLLVIFAVAIFESADTRVNKIIEPNSRKPTTVRRCVLERFRTYTDKTATAHARARFV